MVDEGDVSGVAVGDAVVGALAGAAGVGIASDVEGISVVAPLTASGGVASPEVGLDVDGAGGAGVGSVGLRVSVYDQVRLSRMRNGNSSITRSKGIHK